MHNHPMKNVIVTGANGFIGSSLIKKLVDEGVAVVAVDLSFAVSRLPETSLITKIESGVDASLAETIPAGEYDAFYHLAWRGVNGAEKADPSVQLANIQMAVDCANIRAVFPSDSDFHSKSLSYIFLLNI